MSQPVEIRYTNHQGKTTTRRIMPIALWFGSTEWHPKRQWLLHAVDLDKQAERNFAVQDIVNWKQNEEERRSC